MDDKAPPLTPEQVEALYAERARIENWLQPPPDPMGWRKQAGTRLDEINAALAAHFFPVHNPEGIQRAVVGEYAVMIEPKVNRTLDPVALPAVLKKMNKGSEEKLIDWKPSLKLENWRGLSAKQKEIFAEAMTSKPGKTTFEIVKLPPAEG